MMIALYVAGSIVGLLAAICIGEHIYWQIIAQYKCWQYTRSLTYVAKVLFLFFEFDEEGGDELKELIVAVKTRRLAGQSTPSATILPDIQRYFQEKLPGADFYKYTPSSAEAHKSDLAELLEVTR